MPLKLVTGPANSGKAGVVLGAYRDALGREPVLVVPAFRDVEHSQRELAGRGAVFGTRVVRFGWLFEIVAERCGSESFGAKRASRLQRELIVERAVRDAGLEVLASSAAHPGFVRAADRFVRELGRSMVTPARLAQALGAWAGGGPRERYAHEVAEIYRSYGATLERAGLVDDELYAWHALDALRERPEGWGGAPVFVYGFDDFTPIELGLIEALAAHPGTEVAVSLPYEEGRSAFEAVGPLVERLAGAASEHVALPASAEHYDPGARAALNRVERRLFEPLDPDAADPGEAVRLLSAGGERAEVELVAAEVLRLLRSGTPAGEVAIVFREVDPYASLVEQVLSAYGIPFALERYVQLAHTGLGRGALALLRCATGDGTADDLLTYLRTAGRLDQPHLADRLEHEVRRMGAGSAREAREIWERDRWQLGEIDRLARARDSGALAAQLDEEVERLFGRPYERLAHVFSEAESEDPRAREALRSALSGIRRLARADPALAPPRERLHDLLAAVEVRTGAAAAPDRVQVARPQDIRARRFHAVFACGLQEGEFPRAPRPEPFLPDDDRRAIAQATGLVLPLREERPARERQLFYVCASRAERLLALSWRDTDEEGAPQVRSFLVDDVRALFQGLDAPHATRPLSAVTWAAAEAPTAVERERAHALAGPRRSPPGPERIESEDLLEDLAAGTRLSPAALEAYADCPVKWLVDRKLRPDALEPDPEPMVRGRYAHAVLELTYRRLGERTGSRRVTHESLPEAERILVEALRERQAEFRLSPKATRVRAAVRRLEVDLLRYLRAEADAGSAFEPAELELDFGLEGSLQPALVLGDGIEVGGRIDRVDVWNGHAIVRDYKGGSKVEGVAKWAERNRLQVALYMLAVRDVLGLRPAGGVYQPLKGRDRRARGALLKDVEDQLGTGFVKNDFLDEGELERELDAARERLVELAERMRSGELRPCPETCAWNGGCSYPAICRIER